MVICDKCNAENTTQAVHCVKCGELLAHFSASNKPKKPKVKHDTTSWCYSKHDLGKVIVKSIFGVLVYAMIALTVLILWPSFKVNNLELEKATVAFNRTKVASYSKNIELEYSEQELAAVIRLGMRSFFVQGASWTNMVPRDVFVEFTGAQSFDVLVTYYAVNGFIPLTIVYSVDVPAKGEAPYRLTVNRTKVGLLPLPMKLLTPIIKTAEKSLQESKLSLVESRIRWGKIEDKKLTAFSRINP